MSDLVKRLRDYRYRYIIGQPLNLQNMITDGEEAADKIEQLEKEIERLTVTPKPSQPDAKDFAWVVQCAVDNALEEAAQVCMQLGKKYYNSDIFVNAIRARKKNK